MLTAVPLLVCLGDSRPDVAGRYAIVILIIMVLGGACSRLRVPGNVQRNEAMVISALAFTLPPVLLAVPFMGYGLTYEDAVFEAVSAITTTGLSAAGNVQHLPFSFHFSRAWLQWIGGLGIVTLSVAFVMEAGTVTKRLGFENWEVDEVVGGMRAHARRVLIAYTAITALGIVLLYATGLTAADSILHALAAVSTGGFSNKNNSLAGLPHVGSRMAVIVVCFAGALPFYLYDRASPSYSRRPLSGAGGCSVSG